MRVGIIQSNYVPWRGYFDFIDDVDVFVLLDNVQYTDRDWRNRNRIKTRNGPAWLTVPLRQGPRSQLVQDKAIDWSTDWAGRHLRVLRQNYSEAPFHAEISQDLETVIGCRHARLSELNRALLEWGMSRCGVATRLIDAGELDAIGHKTERLISLVRSVGGTSYLSGPSARAYLDAAAFREAGIELLYKSYDYAPYPQLWGAFDGAVSILDLLMNVGPDARRHLKSRTANLPEAGPP